MKVKQNLQALAKHGNRDMRRVVAKQGYGLDMLIDDEDCFVKSLA